MLTLYRASHLLSYWVAHSERLGWVMFPARAERVEREKAVPRRYHEADADPAAPGLQHWVPASGRDAGSRHSRARVRRSRRSGSAAEWPEAAVYSASMSRVTISLTLLFPAALAAQTQPVVPTTYYRTFSHTNPVWKRIRAGETVATQTIDASGRDLHGEVRHPEQGNPLTGPFFIEGAEPGDAIRVQLRKVRLNRNWGYTRTTGCCSTPWSPRRSKDCIRTNSSPIA